MEKGSIFRKIIAIICMVTMAMTIVGCSGQTSKKSATDTAAEGAAGSYEDKKTGKLELEYATQFSVDYYEGGYSILSIGDGLRYLLMPKGSDTPEWMSDKELKELTKLQLPLENIYLAASQAMDMFLTLGSIDKVTMTSTTYDNWSIDEIKTKVLGEDILYVGKYSAPDYETVLDMGCEAAIESTMIYHTPEVKEQLEKLGIPVMVERSSYEADPLGRMEWIKLYGLLLGKSEEANTLFEGFKSKLDSVKAQSDSEVAENSRPKVAFFYISTSGYATVRKPGDYLTRMIDIAGGSYALGDVIVEDDSALSTMNLQMESFYDAAVDADYLIYSSSIGGTINTIDELLDKSELFKDFKAVKEGNVWCTANSVYQKSTGLSDMVMEMSRIFSGDTVGSDFEYFHLVK